MKHSLVLLQIKEFIKKYRQNFTETEEVMNLHNKILVTIMNSLDKENEELNELGEKLLRKEQECEKLKHKVELMMDCTSCKVDEYKQTLIEIKEIAEPFCNACQEFEPEKRGSNCICCNYGKILQKISEVIK